MKAAAANTLQSSFFDDEQNVPLQAPVLPLDAPSTVEQYDTPPLEASCESWRNERTYSALENWLAWRH